MISRMFGSEKKDVAKILGYSDTDDALRRHVDKKYKMKCPQTSPGETPRQVCWYTFINEPGFTLLFLAQNYRQLKNSKIGYSPRYSHQSVNMANTNCLIVPGIK